MGECHGCGSRALARVEISPGRNRCLAARTRIVAAGSSDRQQRESGQRAGDCSGQPTDRDGAGADFAEKVSKELASGKVAVIVEIDEAWVTPLDTGMEKIGGTVVREWRSDFEEAQLEKEISARKAELAQLKAELSQASENTKGQLKARIDEAKAKLSAAAERDRARMETFRQEVDSKVKELQTRRQRQKVTPRQKSKDALRKYAPTTNGVPAK
jgi:hypothetical protein